MPKSKSGLLASPLEEFKVPIVSWRPTEQQLEHFQNESRITYTLPERIEVKGKEWYCVSVYSVKAAMLGQFLLPFKYHSLWRRLVYGALLQEKMYKAWIERTRRLKGRRLNAVQEEEINLKNMAGVRLVQYLLYRRLVLEELMGLRFENHEPVVHTLIEFGIRESRDWMFETFENAKKEGAKYLRLDPTVQKNEGEFKTGYHSGLGILFPPGDDDWWDGEFSHFDFDATFGEIVNSVPKTMADKSFEKVKWVIESTNRNQPAKWNEANLTFFTESFIDFLMEEDEDPRDVREPYLLWYLDRVDGNLSEISQELKVILGDQYNEAQFNLEQFLTEFGYVEKQNEQVLAQERLEGTAAAADSMGEAGPSTGQASTATAGEGGDSGEGQEPIGSGLADDEMMGGENSEEAARNALSKYVMHSSQLLS